MLILRLVFMNYVHNRERATAPTTPRIMKQLIDIIRQDFHEEGFTRRDYIKYGILAPIAFVALCIIGELLEPSL